MRTVEIPLAGKIAGVRARDLGSVEGVAAGANVPILKPGKFESLGRAVIQALLHRHATASGGTAREETLTLGLGSTSNSLPALDVLLEPADRCSGLSRRGSTTARYWCGLSGTILNRIATRKLRQPYVIVVSNGGL